MKFTEWSRLPNSLVNAPVSKDNGIPVNLRQERVYFFVKLEATAKVLKDLTARDTPTLS